MPSDPRHPYSLIQRALGGHPLTTLHHRTSGRSIRTLCAGRGGRKSGNKSYAGSNNKGSNNGGGKPKVIDLTGNVLGAQVFGMPMQNPTQNPMLLAGMGMGNMHNLPMFGQPNFMGPQTHMCFAPGNVPTVTGSDT